MAMILMVNGKYARNTMNRDISNRDYEEEYKSHVLGIANVGESPYLCTHNVLAKISTCLNNFQLKSLS